MDEILALQISIILLLIITVCITVRLNMTQKRLKELETKTFEEFLKHDKEELKAIERYQKLLKDGITVNEKMIKIFDELGKLQGLLYHALDPEEEPFFKLSDNYLRRLQEKEAEKEENPEE